MSSSCSPTLSFAHFFLTLIAAFAVLILAPWFYVTYTDWPSVAAEHSTISSYCSAPRSRHWFACRLLAIGTMALAISLGGLLIEGYNSGGRRGYFPLDLVFVLAIGLVAIFPSYKEPGSPGADVWAKTMGRTAKGLEGGVGDGGEWEPRKDDGRSPLVRAVLPAVAGGSNWMERCSSFFHFAGAMLFWLGNTGTNLYYSAELIATGSRDAAAWAILVFSSLCGVLFFAFVGLQVYLGARPPADAERKTTLNVASFTVEGVLVLAVTACTVVASLKSSNYFDPI
ncbi:hypothetical protein DFJ74DRAFT_334249 [Hyaloraphidium curvatum]|nr:hypothetical protein DFJ74DRAFT_334249 [Hyaloraphidium curvatum]